MTRLLLLIALGVCLVPVVQAQSFCASDGQATPVALVERFISARCQDCWSAPQTLKTPPRSLTLDWIVPDASNDDAPLSAAATRDALIRLQSLRLSAPATSTVTTTRTVRGTGAQLRVAHGLPFNDYIGASIEMKATSRGPWTAWLLLVETIPAGTDATTVTRNLVRNLLLLNWGKAEMLLKSEHRGFFESRPMSIPEGADPKRLSVVGWVEDKQGRIRSIAQSRCVPVE